MHTRHSLQSCLALAAALCATVLLTACSHYQFGTRAKPVFETLYIAPIQNTADIPQANALFTAQIRDAFIHNGRVTIVNSPSQADATLTVTLARFSRNMTTARTDDTGLARKFDLTVSALCTLTDNRQGKPLFQNRPVDATRQIFTTPTLGATQSKQLQAEYNTMPLIATSLADSITHAVLDVW